MPCINFDTTTRSVHKNGSARRDGEADGRTHVLGKDSRHSRGSQEDDGLGS
jgi:hypothetical protein